MYILSKDIVANTENIQSILNPVDITVVIFGPINKFRINKKQDNNSGT